MRIFFDARMIRHPGIGRYIKCLLQEMLKDNSLDITLLGDAKQLKTIFPSTTAEFLDFRFPIYSLSEQFAYLSLRRTVGDAILHIPHYNVPLLARFRLVATVHDIMHILYPSGASSRFAPYYMKLMLKRLAASCKCLICVSEFTRAGVIQHSGARADLTRVIYEGIGRDFARMDAGYLQAVKSKYTLPDKYVLYVGSIRRHKNIAGLFKAFSSLRKKMEGVSLVMVGRLSQELGTSAQGVVYLGEVSDDAELCAIYNLAGAYCSLSYQEGFGLTILEAQKCGLPVVASDIPAHREIGGRGIIVVGADDVDQAAESLYNVISDQGIRAQAVRLGLENCARFSWERAARQTVEAYASLK